MEITAKLVKDLRECTGAGMMDCKKALQETGGDMDAAVDVLRTKGLAALAKKAGRATNEGIIGGYVTDDRRTGVLVEVNCETDFVARNAEFRGFVDALAMHVATAAPKSMDELLGQTFTGRDSNVEHVLGEAVAKLGENMGIARFERFELGAETGVVSVYIHGVGNIGVIVEVQTDSAEAAGSETLRQFAKDLAMQIAAAQPLAVSRDEVDPAVVAHELEIFKAQAAESGKPEQIQEKMAQGRLEKFFKEFALLEQVFVKNTEQTIQQYADSVAKGLGGSVKVARFTRMVLGETAE